MKIKKVEIEGFRAYKYKEDGIFDFTAADGSPSDFVAIYAPNGFGKSSFYDAVEWAVTNHLERLGGDYNKDNYINAARITKLDGIGQKILRNKDVSSDVVTSVTVSTTRDVPFYRDIRRIRTNARDLRSDGRGRENDFFRRVILSQDEIDRFLREAKPQERYEHFMKSFGGDLEVARKELSALIYDNRAAVTELGRQRDQLRDQLQIPVDASIFNSFNELVAELNESGESIPLADHTFSASTEHELNSIIVSRAHALGVGREALIASQASLIERLSRLPEIQLNIDLMAEQQPKLSQLSKGVLDAGRYMGLLSSHERCQFELQAASERLEKLVEVAKLAGEFVVAESDILAAKEQQRIISARRAELAILVADLEKSGAQKKEELAVADARNLNLRRVVDNCGPTYSDIVKCQGRVSILDSQISEKDVALSLDKAKYSGVESELAKIAALNITASALLTTDVSAIKFDRVKIQELAGFSEELASWAMHDQTIQATQKSLSEQMGLHERLITTGLEYLSLWPTSSCPLCNKPHETSEALKARVRNTGLLSSLSRQNAEKLEASGSRQKELQGKIEAITREALDVQYRRLADLRTKLNELGSRCSTAEREKAELMAEKQTVEAQIQSLQKSVWNLTQEDFVSRAESEILMLSANREKISAQHAELNGHADLNKKSIAEQDASLNAIKVRVEALASGTSYQIVNDYIKENGLSSEGVVEQCQRRKMELEILREEHRAEVEKLVDECKVLHHEMLAEGTWVDFSKLEPQKEQVETQVAKSQSLVQAFFESISRVVDLEGEKTLSEVKDCLVLEINSLALQNQKIDKKINSVNLLKELIKAFKPYLTSLVLQDKLVEVERRLFEMNRVDEALTLEKEGVIAKLQCFVNSFFHEELINSIYRKIDPHPSFKQVEFRVDFASERPGLNIVVKDDRGDFISPILYFSAAQSNILSLSVFLASALHAKDNEGNPVDVIMIDDPIQSMDSINVLATIDLLRSVCLQFKKQIIISTHDENFFGLLQRKIPAEVLGSKFLKLEKFGVVVPVDPFLN